MHTPYHEHDLEVEKDSKSSSELPSKSSDL